MKKLILIGLLLPFWCYGQNAEFPTTFKLAKNNIIWQETYKTDLSFNDFAEAIELSEYFDNVKIKNDYLICKLKPYKLDFRKYGYKWGQTATFISNSYISGNVKFDYKEGNYRVSIKNINFNSEGDFFYSKPNTKYNTFEFLVLNKNNEFKIRKIYLRMYDMMNKDFNIKTTISYDKENADW